MHLNTAPSRGVSPYVTVLIEDIIWCIHRSRFSNLSFSPHNTPRTVPPSLGFSYCNLYSIMAPSTTSCKILLRVSPPCMSGIERRPLCQPYSTGLRGTDPDAVTLPCLRPHSQLLLDLHHEHVGYAPALVCVVQALSLATAERKRPQDGLLQATGRHIHPSFSRTYHHLRVWHYCRLANELDGGICVIFHPCKWASTPGFSHSQLADATKEVYGRKQG